MADSWNSFKSMLREGSCPKNYGVLLNALWWEAKGNWGQAHEMANSLTTSDAAWIHAYLHRVEGDLSNAAYWYRRAGRKQPDCTLEEERKILVEYFMGNTNLNS